MIRVWRILGVGLVLSFYFVIAAPIGYPAFAVWAAMPTRDAERRARRIQRIMGWAFGSMHRALRWMRILDFDPKKLEGEIPKTPCVMVANHPTLVDISAMIAQEPHLIFPVKASLYEKWWARPMLEAARQLHIPERDPFAIARVVEGAAERLAEGYRIIIFPEGTRSPAAGLHPFGRMAFEIAVRAGVPIVPLVITCEPRWLTRDCSFFAKVGSNPRLRIRALAPVHPKDHPDPDGQGSSSRTLRDIVLRRIHAELGLSESQESPEDEPASGTQFAPSTRPRPGDPEGRGAPPGDEASPESHDVRIA